MGKGLLPAKWFFSIKDRRLRKNRLSRRFRRQMRREMAGLEDGQPTKKRYRYT